MPIYKEIVYIDWTVVFTVVNTLILFFVLKHFLYDKVKKVLDSRKAEVEQIYSDADAKNEAASAMKAEYELKLKEAKSTAADILSEAAAKAKTRSDEIVSDGHVKVTHMITQANSQIEQDKKKAVNEMRDEIAGLALCAASQVVERELDDAGHRKLIEDFIEKTGEIKWQN